MPPPRRRRRSTADDVAAAVGVPRSLVASAARVKIVNRLGGKDLQDDWQDKAWQYYDAVGELRYAAQWYGNACSRARLTLIRADDRVEVRAALGEVAANDPDADRLLDMLGALGGGDDGQSQMLAAMALHLFVVGEVYLLGLSPRPDPAADNGGTDGYNPDNLAGPTVRSGEQPYIPLPLPRTDSDRARRRAPRPSLPTRMSEDTWYVLSTSEINTTGDVWTVQRGESSGAELDSVELTDDDLIIRVWSPHPKRHNKADSPVRAVLPILAELSALTKHVGAQIDSRLAGAGILLMPQEMHLIPRTPVTGHDINDGVDAEAMSFTDELGAAMSEAIADQSSAAAMVPIVVEVPADSIKDIRLLTFWSELDKNAVDMRTESIRRLALGLDLPPEILLGQADSNHWSAWSIEEAAIKTHIEPRLQLITAALTDQYLRPQLEAYGFDPDAYYLGYDTSALRLRPDRSTQMFALYDRGEAGGTALRDEVGAGGAAPTPDELRRWALLRLIDKGDAALVAAAVQALGVELNLPERIDGEAATPSQLPQIDNGDTRDVPTTEPGAAVDVAGAALLSAAEVLCARALERAGARVSNRGAYAHLRQVPMTERYRHLPAAVRARDDVLAGAWTLVAPMAERLAVEPGWLTDVLDGYVRHLLDTGEAYQPCQLAARLGVACSLIPASA